MDLIINDKDEAISAVSKSLDRVFFLSDELKSDKDVIRAAIKHNPIAIKYAGVDLQCDPEIVLLALSQDPESLEYCSLKGHHWENILQTWLLGRRVLEMVDASELRRSGTKQWTEKAFNSELGRDIAR
jgi:hypothetical protein